MEIPLFQDITDFIYADETIIPIFLNVSSRIIARLILTLTRIMMTSQPLKPSPPMSPDTHVPATCTARVTSLVLGRAVHDCP